MNTIVVYASRSGNTRLIAEAIAVELRSRGSVELVAAEDAPPRLPEETDLLVVGGPTEGHGMTEPIVRFLDRLAPASTRGLAAAAFDTRLWWPRAMAGSAAAGIAERLQADGARLVVPAESFIVSMKPELRPGEVERAGRWAASIADELRRTAPQPVGAAT